METGSQKLKIYFDLLKNAPKRVVLMSPKEDEVTLYKKHIMKQGSICLMFLNASGF